MYGYAIPLFHACFVRHGPHLKGVDQQTDYGITSNYTPDILSYYAGCWNQERLQLWSSSVV
jgi:hypothetical protein